jgi:hypothetical protein
MFIELLPGRIAAFQARIQARAGYAVLNAIRVLNIASLLLVIAASIVLLSKTFVVSKFFVFDGFSQLVRIIISSMGTVIASMG